MGFKKFGFVALLQFCCIVQVNSALAYSMRCKLDHVFQLTEKGQLFPNSLEAAYLENDLVVDMATGIVYHIGFGNESYPIKSILDQGSVSSSFKLLSSSIPRPASDNEHSVFINTIYLQINTWVTEQKKPFLVVESNNFSYGVCG